jgi:paraquat-inducible protein B
MNTRARHVWIGAFVVGALLIVTLGIALLGRGLGRGNVRAVMVFRGNVTGLEIGTPVVFRGMKIGEVRRMRTLYDPENRSVSFLVYADFSGTIEVAEAAERSGDDRDLRRAWIDDMIGHGLRAQLQARSFVTGQQMVMLDFFDDGVSAYTRAEQGVLEIPTVRSPSEEIFDSIRELPVRELVVDGQKLLTNLNALLAPGDAHAATVPGLLARLNLLAGSLEKEVPAASGEFTHTAREVRRLLIDAGQALATLGEATRTLQHQVQRGGDAFESTAQQIESLTRTAEGSAGELSGAITRLEGSLTRLDQTLARVDHTLSEDSPIGAGLTGSLSEIAAAAQSLRQTLEALNRRPDALLFGRRPEDR